MRNSNVMAIAPTATISTIIGVTQSIEPTYKHLYVKSNLSGEFVQININLVNELKERNLWDDEMLQAIKYYDGSLGEIDRLPQDVKDRYATSFEIEPKWLIECASRRQKWIDMGQSLNLYMEQPSGRKLDEMYKLAWQKGLKTTYYLRSLGATQVEKSTVDINKFGMQPRWMKNKSASSDISIDRDTELSIPESAPKACSIMDPDCEACQ
jgi:ribonucleoside-diphosphate reductase alpha chain